MDKSMVKVKFVKFKHGRYICGKGMSAVVASKGVQIGLSWGGVLLFQADGKQTVMALSHPSIVNVDLMDLEPELAKK